MPPHFRQVLSKTASPHRQNGPVTYRATSSEGRRQSGALIDNRPAHPHFGHPPAPIAPGSSSTRRRISFFRVAALPPPPASAPLIQASSIVAPLLSSSSRFPTILTIYVLQI